ncbi:MAG: PAS domain S-box protein [Gemmatimonadales bacterium]|nr:PAS domain S-box protein [Gemmatimonadales bacterium]
MTDSTQQCPRCATPLVSEASYCHACGAWVAVARQGGHQDYKRLFDYSVDLLCIAGTDGYFKLVNPAFERELGYTAAELLARPFVELTHPNDRDVTVAETDSLAGGQPTLSFSNRYRTKDGRWVRMHWTAYPEPGTGLIYASARVEPLEGDGSED